MTRICETCGREVLFSAFYYAEDTICTRCKNTLYYMKEMAKTDAGIDIIEKALASVGKAVVHGKISHRKGSGDWGVIEIILQHSRMPRQLITYLIKEEASEEEKEAITGTATDVISVTF